MKKSLWWKLCIDKEAIELIIQERESKRYHLWTNAEDRVLQMLKDKTNDLPAKSKLKSLLPSDEQCTIRWNFLQRVATNSSSSSSSSNSKDSLKKDQQSNKRQRQYQAKQKKAKQELQKQYKAKQELHQRKTQQDRRSNRLFMNRMMKIERDKELDRVAQIESTRNRLKRERERIYQRKKAEEDDKRRRLDRQEEERQEDAANERRWRHAREEKDRQRRSCARKGSAQHHPPPHHHHHPHDQENQRTTAKKKTQTHYQILDVHWKATDTEIKKAYRTLAMKHHPDKNNAKEAEAIMVQINSAYECLKSITKRKKYDYTLNTKEESIDHSEHEQNVNYQQGDRHDQDEQDDEQNQDYKHNQDYDQDQDYEQNEEDGRNNGDSRGVRGGGGLPDHYICYRCNNRGHHSDHCPDCPVSSTNYYQPTYNDVQTFYQETTHLH